MRGSFLLPIDLDGVDKVASQSTFDVAAMRRRAGSRGRSERERTRITVRVGLAVAVGVTFVLLWAALARASTPDVLPGPSAVWLRLVQSVHDGQFFPAAGTTAEEAGLGWLIAAAFSLPVGYAIGRFRILEDALAPYLAGSQAMPVVAIAPILLIWLGAGLASKVSVAALIAFFPMLATTASGIRGVPRDLTDAGRVFGATGWPLARFVYLPLAARAVFSGVKVAAALSVTGAVVGEFIASDQGLGYLINVGRVNFDTPLTFVAVLALIAMGAVAYSLFGLLERLVLRWEE
jgi:NitT/TauT family transport system permease protein